MNSKIATARDLSLLQKTINKPDEQVLHYSVPLAVSSPGELYHILKKEFASFKFLDDLFERASKVRSHLGEWCANRYWGFALAEERSKKMESRVEKFVRASSSAATADREIEQIHNAIDLVTKYDFGKPRADLSDLSHKVRRLHDFLACHYERPSNYRCIVFVEQRSTAYLLRQVFEAIGGPHLHSGLLMGAGNNRLDDVQSTFRDQVVTLIKFRKGELNCLFATSVAEEGLDIPDCNLVVRFDICKTMIQYVQSRGRARHKNSKFLHMVESYNYDHDHLLRENRGAEGIMRIFCEALPADRELAGDNDMLYAEEVMAPDRTYLIPSTGAKVTWGSALQILSHFVDSLPRDGEDALQPTYTTTSQGGRFICEVILPYPSPVRSVIGAKMRQKSLAKRSAAFKACIELWKKKYLDDNLVPIFTKRLPAMRNAALALSSKKSGMYDVRLKPRTWDEGRGSIPSCLYFTHLDVSDGLDRPHQPLLLITRKPMPVFPKFPLHLNKGRKTYVTARPLPGGYSMTEDALIQITSFTLRVFKDLFNKTYEPDPEKMPYWIGPASTSANNVNFEDDPLKIVDWKLVDHVRQNEGFQWDPSMPDSFLVDKFLVDKWDGGRRFFSTRIAPEFKPTDPVPEGTASSKWRANILDYTVSLWQKARQARVWNPDQPVIEADRVLHRRNMLADPTSKECQDESNLKSFLCPEPLKISAVRVIDRGGGRVLTLNSSLLPSCRCATSFPQ